MVSRMKSLLMYAKSISSSIGLVSSLTSSTSSFSLETLDSSFGVSVFLFSSTFSFSFGVFSASLESSFTFGVSVFSSFVSSKLRGKVLILPSASAFSYIRLATLNSLESLISNILLINFCKDMNFFLLNQIII